MSDQRLVHLCSLADNGEAAVLRSYLEHNGILVYIQGENHRSLLGMVGTYIELHCMVPESQLTDAQELLAEYQEGVEIAEPPEMRGTYRDVFVSEDQDDEEVQEGSLTRSVTKGKVLFGALFCPFGGGHFLVGSNLRGFLLGVLSLIGIGLWRTQSMGLALWAAAIATDAIGAYWVVRARDNSGGNCPEADASGSRFR